jgi:magnesium and cobalt transporter
MPEDPSSSVPERRSWLDRLGQMLSGEARNREDLLEELRTAHANGLLSADTLKMIEGAIAVSDQQVSDVMLPRAQIVAIDVDAPMPEVIATVVESGHSRFPVHGEDRDDILGVLLAKDLLRAFASPTAPHGVRDLLRPAVLIPESKRLNVLLKEFRQSRNHMAIVMDEYGGVAGLVTIEDVLEQIVGEIDDEHDDAEGISTQIAALADGQFRVDALTPIDEFNAHFGSELPDDDYDTIGGLVTDAIGHLPEPGEELTLGNFHFRVAGADARRVHAFTVAVLPGD